MWAERFQSTCLASGLRTLLVSEVLRSRPLCGLRPPDRPQAGSNADRLPWLVGARLRGTYRLRISLLAAATATKAGEQFLSIPPGLKGPFFHPFSHQGLPKAGKVYGDQARVADSPRSSKFVTVTG